MPSPTPPPGPGLDPVAAVRRVRRAMSDLTAPLEARISPDGRQVAVTVTGPHGTGVVLAPAHGPAVAMPAVTGARHTPRWLPDSRTLLLMRETEETRDAGEPDGAGLPVLTAWDTRTGVRRDLVSVPGAVEDMLVADDGSEILLLVADDGAERDGMNLGLPVRLGAAPDPESHRPGTGRRRLLHGLLPPSEAPTGPRPAGPVALRDAGPPELTVWNTAWRGGRTVVATVSEDPLPAGYYTAWLARVDLTDGSTTVLHRPEGQLSAPALAPDGRSAVVAEGISIVAGRPVVVDLADGTVTTTSAVEDVTWLLPDPRDPARLLTAGWSGTGSRLAAVRLDRAAPGGVEATVLREEQAVLTGAGFRPALTLSADGRTAATVREAPGEPPQAVVAPTHGPHAWAWRPVTTPDPAAARRAHGGHLDLARVRTRPTAWTASDGRTVHGLLLDAPAVPAPCGPHSEDRDAPTPPPPRPRPLAVVLHGGPSWQWSAAHAPADVLGLGPALAAAGWLVLLPNPRGSSGYGLDHARAVVGDVGEGDLDDVLTGVAHLTAHGAALPGRAAVLGHSYGGFLAALAAARTDAFRAAVVVSAPTDWLSFTHTSVIGGGYERTYGIGDAATAEGRTALLARSPVFADGGTGTPTLVLHGEQDRVTPAGQAHELYRTLARRATAPVELHLYPGEGHEFTRPDHLLDAATRAAAWLTRHVTPEAARTSATEGPDDHPPAAPPRPDAATPTEGPDDHPPAGPPQPDAATPTEGPDDHPPAAPPQPDASTPTEGPDDHPPAAPPQPDASTPKEAP
ncbi:alpha/beta fold hydrolase [Streptomyces sp. NPDC088812]|uniref:S9 family peptidase n=1 Tax=Streptomyces sp. NPDC088812 TaxID=3365905 RepID=UPI003822DFFF